MRRASRPETAGRSPGATRLARGRHGHQLEQALRTGRKRRRAFLAHGRDGGRTFRSASRGAPNRRTAGQQNGNRDCDDENRPRMSCAHRMHGHLVSEGQRQDSQDARQRGCAGQPRQAAENARQFEVLPGRTAIRRYGSAGFRYTSGSRFLDVNRSPGARKSVRCRPHAHSWGLDVVLCKPAFTGLRAAPICEGRWRSGSACGTSPAGRPAGPA